MNNRKIDFDNLISRCLSGEATNEESAKLEQWLNASPKNRQLYSQLESIWQNANPEEPTRMPDIEQSWSAFENRLPPGSRKTRARLLPFNLLPSAASRASYLGGRAVAISAGVAIVVGAIILLWGLQKVNQWRVITTHNAERIQLTLPDRSSVTINYDSTIKYPRDFSDSNRRVLLTGEAFFEVTPHSDPFIVKTENARIRVLGTKFNIWARDEQTRVIVQEGRVSLKALDSTDDERIVLTAKQMSICRKSAVPNAPLTVDSERLLGWLQNRIVFERTPLTQIIAELQRIYDIRIELASRALGKNTLTGTFHNKPIETVLTSICITLNLKYTYSADRYTISEK